jgi:uncharacterized RDD family membrane protein YckC
MDMETNVQHNEQDIFTEQDIFQYEYASTGQRFLNWLIDNLLMRFGLSWVTGYLVGLILVKLFPNFYIDMVYSKGIEFYFLVYIIAIFNYIIYYTFCEKVFGGYTLGKLITGTKAINEDGSELTLKSAFLRSVSRLVPFEALSIWIGDGLWHDAWTKTMVIKTR